MKFLYTDFSFTIIDYIFTIKKREIVYEWVVPLALSILVYFKINDIPGISINCDFIKSIISILINMFAILVGFTMAAIAIFTTADISKIEILGKESERKIHGKPISNYRFVFLNLIYSAISSLFMLLLTLFFTVALYFDKYSLLIIAVLCFGTLHVLLLSIRNITTLYFIFFNQK
ncbi:hypothetical protein SAMN02746065_11987 [Desulfocicer vacuolatum DSM 3385]|uniref:Uncharacterized protein n=1 Tax=Desulfocicer vacuolatum DSM 3385 TaxID=1121400 RepID=A0A1W2DQK3_9BACT|nr:hypothetical protein [Desulfocicer vacuolatum]SMC99673.1 hypothetical protein SAMN02746065_11987 [Desulfocicer vacuolatum DSM 3385]